MFARLKPSGWVNDIDTIDQNQINGIDINQSRALDGTGGSAGTPYTPSTNIILGGSNQLEIVGTGGLLVNGTGQAQWVRTPTRSYVLSQALRISNLNQQVLAVGSIVNGGSGAPQEASAWLVAGDVSSLPAIRTSLEAGAGNFFWLALDCMPDGAVVNFINITTKGLGSSSNPSTKADYQIVSYDLTTLNSLSSVTADAHSYGPGNWLTTAVTTSVTPTSGTFTVDYASGLKYALAVNCPADVGVGSAMYAYHMTVSFDMTTIRAF